MVEEKLHSAGPTAGEEGRRLVPAEVQQADSRRAPGKGGEDGCEQEPVVEHGGPLGAVEER